MFKAYKYRIYPNEFQQEQIKQHIGSCRWIYNYALEKKMKAWNTDKKNLSKFDISNDLPKLKKTKETKWLKEVNSQSLQSSLEHLDKAYTRFFRLKKGFPKFKSKHNNKQSFSVPQYVKIDFDNGKIKIPKIEPIKVKFDRLFDGNVKTTTIQRTSTNKYYVSVLVETTQESIAKKSVKERTTIGIDLGIKDFVVLSTGEKIENPKILKQHEKKLRKAQRTLSRRVKNSHNRNKAKLKVALIYEKISNIRKDFLHKLSHKLTHESQVKSIVIENLNVNGMLQNHKLAKSISDCSWSEFVRQLDYKSEWYGINLIKIGRYEPSSKLCSNCGIINKEMTLNDREWICEYCEIKHDRDINAAINIKKIGLNPKIPMEHRKLTLVESSKNTLYETRNPFLDSS